MLVEELDALEVVLGDLRAVVLDDVLLADDVREVFLLDFLLVFWADLRVAFLEAVLREVFFDAFLLAFFALFLVARRVAFLVALRAVFRAVFLRVAFLRAVFFAVRLAVFLRVAFLAVLRVVGIDVTPPRRASALSFLRPHPRPTPHIDWARRRVETRALRRSYWAGWRGLVAA